MNKQVVKQSVCDMAEVILTQTNDSYADVVEGIEWIANDLSGEVPVVMQQGISFIDDSGEIIQLDANDQAIYISRVSDQARVLVAHVSDGISTPVDNADELLANADIPSIDEIADRLMNSSGIYNLTASIAEIIASGSVNLSTITSAIGPVVNSASGTVKRAYADFVSAAENTNAIMALKAIVSRYSTPFEQVTESEEVTFDWAQHPIVDTSFPFPVKQVLSTVGAIAGAIIAIFNPILGVVSYLGSQLVNSMLNADGIPVSTARINNDFGIASFNTPMVQILDTSSTNISGKTYGSDGSAQIFVPLDSGHTAIQIFPTAYAIKDPTTFYAYLRSHAKIVNVKSTYYYDYSTGEPQRVDNWTLSSTTPFAMLYWPGGSISNDYHSTVVQIMNDVSSMLTPITDYTTDSQIRAGLVAQWFLFLTSFWPYVSNPSGSEEHNGLNIGLSLSPSNTLSNTYQSAIRSLWNIITASSAPDWADIVNGMNIIGLDNGTPMSLNITSQTDFATGITDYIRGGISYDDSDGSMFQGNFTAVPFTLSYDQINKAVSIRTDLTLDRPDYQHFDNLGNYNEYYVLVPNSTWSIWQTIAVVGVAAIAVVGTALAAKHLIKRSISRWNTRVTANVYKAQRDYINNPSDANLRTLYKATRIQSRAAYFASSSGSTISGTIGGLSTTNGRSSADDIIRLIRGK